LELASIVHEIMLEGKKAAQRSNRKLRTLQRRLNFLKSSSKTSSVVDAPLLGGGDKGAGGAERPWLHRDDRGDCS
jgi:hypothetical protein